MRKGLRLEDMKLKAVREIAMSGEQNYDGIVTLEEVNVRIAERQAAGLPMGSLADLRKEVIRRGGEIRYMHSSFYGLKLDKWASFQALMADIYRGNNDGKVRASEVKKQLKRNQDELSNTVPGSLKYELAASTVDAATAVLKALPKPKHR